MASALRRAAGLAEPAVPSVLAPAPAEPDTALRRAAKRPAGGGATWDDPFSAESIAARDLPVEPEYPIEALFSVIPGFKAATLAGGALPKALPWLFRSMASGAAAGATGGAIAESGRGPRGAATGALVGAGAGALLSPPLEAGAGAVGRMLRGGPVSVPGKPLISPVEPTSAPPLASEAVVPGPASTGVPAVLSAPEQALTRTGPTTGRTVPQVVKLDKVGLAETSPEFADVQKALDALGMGERRVRSFADMQAAAEELGMRPADLLKGASARPISDAEVVATANLINDAATLHAQAITKLAAPGLSESESIALQQQVNSAWNILQQALNRRIKGGTESGRAIAAFRIIGQRNMDPAYWYTVAQRRLGEKELPDAVAHAIRGAIESGDRVALARIVGRLGEAGWADKLSTLARAFMLSNPGTDVRNIGGNLSRAIMDGTADIPATMLDALMAKVTGIRSKSVSLRQVGEGLRGIRSGVEKAGEVLRHGDTAEEVLARYDFGSGTHFDNKAAEFFTQAVFRRLGAEDYLFRQPHFFRAIAELAEVTAKNEGLKGGAYAARVAELIKTPTDQMKAVAQAVAAERTFNQPSALASGLSQLERRAGPAGKLLGTVVMPFKRTPINVARTIVDYSPIRAPLAVIKYAATKGKGDQMLRQRYLVEGVGRSLTGTSLAAIGYMLAQNGLATGGPPSNADEKNLRYALGIPNYAVKVGDEWVAINNNAPLSNVLMLGVDAAFAFASDKPAHEQAATAAGSLAKGLSEQTFVRGVKSATEAAYDPGRYGGSWLESVAGIMVPSLVGALARGTDPYERRIENPLQAVQARIPGARGMLEPQVTAEGDQRRQQTGAIAQVLSPIRKAQAREDALARALDEAGWAPGVPQNPTLKSRGREAKLSPEEMTRFQIEVGSARTIALQALIKRPAFARMDADQKRTALRRESEQAEEQIRNRWKREKAGEMKERPRGRRLAPLTGTNP